MTASKYLGTITPLAEMLRSLAVKNSHLSLVQSTKPGKGWAISRTRPRANRST